MANKTFNTGLTEEQLREAVIRFLWDYTNPQIDLMLAEITLSCDTAALEASDPLNPTGTPAIMITFGVLHHVYEKPRLRICAGAGGLFWATRESSGVGTDWTAWQRIGGST